MFDKDWWRITRRSQTWRSITIFPLSPAFARVWKAERFSRTTMFHTFPHSPFDQKMQLAELKHRFRPRAAATGLAENCVGLSLF
jgi:hypothetical protein